MTEQPLLLSKEETPQPLPPERDVVTVVDSIYYQPTEGSPVTIFDESCRFCRELETNEQPYIRHKVATEEWLPLDKGWIEKCSILILKNNAGSFSFNPTNTQKAQVKNKVIELSFDSLNHTSIIVPPGEACRFSPLDLDQIYIRSKSGAIKYSLCLISE